MHSEKGAIVYFLMQLCSVGVSLPLELPRDSSLLGELDHTPLHLRLHPLTPGCQVTDVRWSQCVALRGLPTSYPLWYVAVAAGI